MKKLSLRSEHLAELSTAEMRNLVGAAPQAGTVSDGSCVCTFGQVIVRCDISDGSCVCTGDTR